MPTGEARRESGTNAAGTGGENCAHVDRAETGVYDDYSFVKHADGTAYVTPPCVVSTATKYKLF